MIAIEHPEDKPEFDWWVLGGKSTAGHTPGNNLLIAAGKKLADWIKQELGITSFRQAYHIELGAIYMKDTAVLAGLGCIGKNNLLVTPQYGPRQRLRVILVDADLPATGPSDFNPCHDCDMPCRTACPVKAFDKTLYTAEEYGFPQLLAAPASSAGRCATNARTRTARNTNLWRSRVRTSRASWPSSAGSVNLPVQLVSDEF